ncbi:T6SS effector phospholipase Tle3 domain-containing protein [Stenotrophomonas bentonitica]
MTTTDHAAGPRVSATGTLRTAPGGIVQPVVLPMPKPGIVILIHGVNDVGEAFANQELGLCLGLSERLGRVGKGASRMLLGHAYYRKPRKKSAEQEEDRHAVDPDAVYYRRHHTKAATNQKEIPNSVVIPFYWGYREEEGTHKDKNGNIRPNVRRNERHGEYLDRYGNRLDKDSAKNGGPFANATNNIPAMWSAGFKALPGEAGSTKTRPLLSAGPRNYMVLAAQRLAMLVRMIRDKHPDDTINVVAHSQGCLITLLANALLKETNDRPIDTFVMNHPPYGLGEVMADKLTLGGQVETVEARLNTLTGIVRFMTETPHHTPAFESLAETGQGSSGNAVVTGKHWKPTWALRIPQGEGNAPKLFDERDNRGKVYLYFCPDDQTVALLSVQGIGWQGVPDTVSMFTTDSYQRWRKSRVMLRGSEAKDYMVVRPALDALGPRFKQRCFTKRLRDGKPLMIGAAPGEYELEKWHEFAWSGTTLGTFTDRMARAGFSSGQKVRITGEVLSPAVRPRLGSDWDDISPIDASIAITRDKRMILDWETFPGVVERVARRPQNALPGEEIRLLEKQWNAGKDVTDQTEISYARHTGRGGVEIRRRETPNEARRRWMDIQKSEDNKKSFHSSIVAEAQHSREVTAYDLGIGQAKCIDDPVYYLYLCLVADWRTDWDRAEEGIDESLELTKAERMLHSAAFALRQKEVGSARELIDQTIKYRKTGKLPACAFCERPQLVVSQTLADREANKIPNDPGTGR